MPDLTPVPPKDDDTGKSVPESEYFTDYVEEPDPLPHVREGDEEAEKAPSPPPDDGEPGGGDDGGSGGNGRTES